MKNSTNFLILYLSLTNKNGFDILNILEDNSYRILGMPSNSHLSGLFHLIHFYSRCWLINFTRLSYFIQNNKHLKSQLNSPHWNFYSIMIYTYYKNVFKVQKSSTTYFNSQLLAGLLGTQLLTHVVYFVHLSVNLPNSL